MEKRTHGPAFKAQQLELAVCQTCCGKAFIKGVFHDLFCVQCNASGWVEAGTGYALSLEFLVTHLSLKLQQAQQQIELLERGVPTGPVAQYTQNNRRGAGGSNFTGD
ncbi:hypothetical protein [Pseudomonas putida]|uniref:hypothetical protein n=1 Tax=Pseudomonas putida TaxID=303 RepID=UPI000980B941|nr:hypothetical protein [Pseudomonas putida]OMQ41059.1 hypothetical protein BKX96_04515 [Pseudomonas putida]